MFPQLNKVPDGKSPLSRIRHIQRILVEADYENNELVFGYIWSDTKKSVAKKYWPIIEAARVPPLMENVRINPDPNAKLMATGNDKKGRLIGLYSLAFRYEKSKKKFKRVREFAEIEPHVKERVIGDLYSKDAKIREAARVVYLILQGSFRPGSHANTKADKKAYGAATLLRKHVKLDKDKVTFTFIGKKGVKINQTIEDSLLADVMKEQLQEEGDRLFSSVQPSEVNLYLKSIAGKYTPKDIRTYNATKLAQADVVKTKGPAKDVKTFHKWQRKTALKVSRKLNNTASVAMNEYIDPETWAPWRQKEWGEWVPPKYRPKKQKDENI